MRFFSDNAAPVHPKVMEAIAAANVVDTAYDGDAWSQKLTPHLALFLKLKSACFGCPLAPRQTVLRWPL
jgi:threonine aldolase